MSRNVDIRVHVWRAANPGVWERLKAAWDSGRFSEGNDILMYSLVYPPTSRKNGDLIIRIWDHYLEEKIENDAAPF